MQTTDSFTTVLFVGGESRRMGADKATLIFEGEPLWARQLATLRKLSPEKILVSARTKPPWCPPEIEMVLDAPPSRGPLSGLAAALKKITTTHLFALAVDLPLMTADHLCWLQSQIDSGVGVMPVLRGHCEPLGAIYPLESSRLAQSALSGDDVSMNSFIAKLRQKKMLRDCAIEAGRAKFYRNANAPEDLL